MKPQISTSPYFDADYERDCWDYLAEHWLEQIEPDRIKRNSIAIDAESGYPIQAIRLALWRALERGIDIPEYYLQAIEEVLEADILADAIADLRARPGHQLEAA